MADQNFALDIKRWYNYPNLVVMFKGDPYLLTAEDSQNLLRQLGINKQIGDFPSYAGNVSARSTGLNDALRLNQLELQDRQMRQQQINQEQKGTRMNALADFSRDIFSKEGATGISSADMEAMDNLGIKPGDTEGVMKYIDTLRNNQPNRFQQTDFMKFWQQQKGKSAEQIRTAWAQQNQPSQLLLQIANANPQAIANKDFINALYKQAFNRDATKAELDKFADKYKVADAANIILGQTKSPFVGQSGGTVTPSKLADITGAVVPSGAQLPSALKPPEQPQKAKFATAGQPGGTTPPPATFTGGWNFELAGNNQFLVKFSDDPTPADPATDTATVWLFDNSTKTYRPFSSMQALESYFGKPASELVASITTIPTTHLNEPNSSLKGQFLSANEAIKEDGKIPAAPSPQNAGTASYSYGQNVDPTLTERAVNFLGTTFTTLKNKYNAISQQTFDSIFKNPTMATKYASAVAYGGYTVGDVFRDIKAKELGLNLKGIDDLKSAADFYKTPEYASIVGNPQVQVPVNIDVDPNIFKLPIFQIPGSAFSTLVSPLDVNSPTFKEEAEKIQASWYDLMLQQAEANTAQEKSLADDNLRIFRADLEKKFGWQLSDNAQTAWNQLQQLLSTGQQRGLTDSGILQEAQNRYLEDIRKSNERLRYEKGQTETAQERERLLKYGTPEEIAKLPEETARNWGLIPSQEVKDFVAKNPQLRGILMDDSGRYRSQAFQDLFTKKFGISEGKKTYQEQQLEQRKLLEEERAYAPFTRSYNPFSSYQPDYANTNLPFSSSTPKTPGTVKMTPPQIQLPAGYEKILKPEEMGKYTNITKPGYNPYEPKVLYGKPKLKF